VVENAGAAATLGTVTRHNTTLSAPLTINLSSNDTTELIVPATVTIPTDAASATFNIDAVDDDLLHGAKTVTITATRSGHAAGSADIEVKDYETLTVQMAANRVLENDGTAATTLTVTRSNAGDLGTLTVNLSSDDTTEATLPASVGFSTNEESVSVAVDAIDDTWLDGEQRVWITASAAGYESIADTLDVGDHEPLDMSLSNGTVTENAGLGAITGSLSRNHEMFDASRLYVTHENELREYSTENGIQLVKTVPVPYADRTRPGTETVRDLVRMPDGKIAVYNGTFAPWLSLLDPTADFWKHGAAGAQSTEDTAGYGGIATYKNYAFLTDMDTVGNPTIGMVRINTFDRSVQRFGASDEYIDVTMGWDGLLYGLVSDEFTVHAYDPESLALHRTIWLSNSVRGVAVDDAGTLFAASWDNHIYHFADDGSLLSSIDSGADNLTDIDLTAAGKIAVGSRLGDIVLTDTSLNAVDRFNVGSSPTFVAFGAPVFWDDSVTASVSSSDTTEADVAGPVVFPVGGNNAAVVIDVFDDALLDGSQTVFIAASASGYADVTAVLTVVDYETLHVTLDAPSISENGGFTTGHVRRSNTDISLPLTVQLASSDTSEAAVPTIVTIPADETSVAFDVAGLDDDLLDGTQTAAITATAAGYMSGVNTIDVTDHETLTVIIVPSAISENGGMATATIKRSNTDDAQALTVALAADDSSEATVPPSVTIPASANSATIDVAAVDDNVLDGTQTVTITATAAGYVSLADTLDVTDFESLSVSIAGGPISENNGSATGTVTRNNVDISQAITVSLISDDTSEATVPASVTIPANASAATFPITSGDDQLLDGTQTATVSATAPGYQPASAAIDVTDYESLTVSIVADWLSEQGGSSSATVSRSNSDRSVPLTVNLTSDDTGEATAPSSVTIPADASSATFTVTALDDGLVDGTQTVTVAATAVGYVGGTATVDVTDHKTLTVSIQADEIAENAGAAATTGTVTRTSPDISSPLVVTLISDDDTEARVASSVTIPANQASAEFSLDAVDDNLHDGTVPVTISATAYGHVSGSDTLDVTDMEQLSLDIADDSIAENDGPAATTGTVTRHNTNLDSKLIVQLISSDSSEAGAPIFVTILAGASSTTFNVWATDDALLDGTIPVTITASAPDYESASDNLDVSDHETLDVSLPVSEVREDAGIGAMTAMVTRSNTDNDAALVVTLTSADTSELRVPTTVTIPANDSSATFEVDAVDDNLLDGTIHVTVTASAPGYVSAPATVNVTDHETLTFTIDADAVSENDGNQATTATVWRSDDETGSELTVTISSSDTSEIRVPDTVTIAASDTSATFDIEAVDDDLLDGPVSVTVSASAAGYGSVSDSLNVTDHETLPIVFATDSIQENAGSNATTGTLSRTNSDIGSDLAVSLTSSDTTELVVPSSITIPANATSVTFPVAAVDDDVLDGSKTVAVTASASGYTPSQDTIEVSDHEELTISVQDPEILENDGVGATTAQVTRNNSDVDSELIVALASDDTSEIQVPAQITIPANAASVTFSVDAVDDDILDGPQTVILTASAGGYQSDSDTVDVLDQESVTVTFQVDTIYEDDGVAATTGTVARSNSDMDTELTVTLTNSDSSEIQIPASVTIPANTATTTFDVDAVDDNLLDGTARVTVTASASGYAATSSTLNVLDHETMGLTIHDDTIPENAGPGATTATLTRDNSDIQNTLVVTLDTSGSTKIHVPASVTIPANASSVAFAVDAVDDDLLTGTVVASVTASASGYESATDGVDVSDHETLTVTVQHDAVSEGSGLQATTAFIYRSNTNLSAPLVVTLSSSDISEAQVPATVTLPSLVASATVTIDAVDDTILDGTATVTLTAAASGYVDGSDTLDVTDDEVLQLVIDRDEIRENAGQGVATATITRSNTDIDSELVVYLASSDATEVRVPPSVVISAHTASATFAIDAVDDALLDGTVPVTVTASASGYAPATDGLDVTDHEQLSLVIRNASIPENGAVTTATVTRSNTDTASPLTVNLDSDDLTESTLPLQVTIPANEVFATFDIHAIDDDILDGTVSVSISAAATGYETASSPLDVTDHEVLSVTVVDASISENGGATMATVTRGNIDIGTLLTVAITSSDASEATVPATLVIPANQPAARFTVAGVMDNVADGPQTVTVTASADGYQSVPVEIEILDTSWHNTSDPADVNGDGVISPIDALQVINELNEDGARPLPPPSQGSAPPPYVDVSGDGLVSPVDALIVINRLNGVAGEGEASGYATPQFVWAADARGTNAAPQSEPLATPPRQVSLHAPLLARAPDREADTRSRDRLFGAIHQPERNESLLDDVLEAISTDISSAWAT